MTATTAAARPQPTRSLGDRYAEVSVVLVTLLALALGWALKSAVEARAVPFEAAGITAQVPAGWVRTTGGETELLHVTDPASAGFGTTYVIAAQPVAAGTTEAQVASLVTLARGQALTAYRVLSQQPVTLNGRPAYMLTFVYVESDPDLTHEALPHVVRGVEFVFLDGERAVTVAYHADVDAYEADYGRFRRFLDSVSF
jgi:hypothetical protein